MKERPGKRTNPRKLAEEREKARRDMLIRNQGPQPNIFQKFGQAFDEAVERKRRRKRPPPVMEGSYIVGFKKPEDTA